MTEKNAFGSKEYAKEELIAELSSVFVQADLGIDIGAKQLSNHAAYLQNWIGALEENPNVLFQASSDASRASDFLMEQYQKSFIMEQKKENGMVQNADGRKRKAEKKKICQPFDGKSVFSEIKKGTGNRNRRRIRTITRVCPIRTR